MTQAAVAQDTASMETIVVLGVRGAEQKSIDLKRSATSIQDSIAAEDIGKLPDATIADSLQRIPGIQIDRSAGEGSSVNIRGLPQVGTTLNGEMFLTSTSIVSVQPSFVDVPSQLFAGADVIKATTANILNGGITGTIDLKTRRPFDMSKGWTLAAAADIAHGFDSKKWQPEANTLIGYNGGRWGALVSASYADVTMETSQDGMDLYGGEIFGENAASATESSGFIGSFNGATLPSTIKVLNADGDVDVDNDGKANSAFYGSTDFTVIQRLVERKRLGINASAQADLGSGFKLTGDAFYTELKAYQRSSGYMLESSSWIGASFVPVTTRDTGVKAYPDYNTLSDTQKTPLEFYTTQVYRKYVGDMETYAENAAANIASRNFNLQLDYDNGGNFTGTIRAIAADASMIQMNAYTQFTMGDGAIWNNQGGAYTGTTTYHFPSSAGGDRIFNPHGYASNAIEALVDMRGDHMAIGFDSAVLANIDSKSAWVLKTVTSEGDYERDAGMQVIRADGHYRFGGSGISLDGGIRYGTRSAKNTSFNLIAPVYAGSGASESAGCYAHYMAADVVLNNGGVDGSCTAGDANGYYVANPYAGYAMDSSKMPDIIAKNIRHYSNVAGVDGIGFYNLDPKAMDNVLSYMETLYPGEKRNINPGDTWKVGVRQVSGYLQGNVDATLVLPFNFNAGLRVIQTSLDVTQHLVGDPQAYGLYSADKGTAVTKRSFTDVLPNANLNIDILENFKMRMAYSKNMQLLDLNQWAGGLTLGYSIDTSTGIFAVHSGSQSGNPDLDPWRSSNYDVSFEYYLTSSSMVNFALFYIDMDSWISSDNVTRCDLPDQDGVVRGRCVTISGPIQGKGKNLKGMEIGFRQAFDFLPGFWKNFGTELNYTYSPSNVGQDMAGNKIPFQDNSDQQANMVLWYQDDEFQARLAGNYRSKRAVSNNFGGVSGLQEYQRPTFYLDASMSYDYTPNWQVYLEGQNILGQEEHYYLVWKDQKADTTRFEPRVTMGVRAKF
jgi:TonB-dependent receptor